MSISSVFHHNTPELLHPDLRSKDRAWLYLRAEFPFRYWFPEDERVGWYGGALRENGAKGLYMTGAQAKEYKNWEVSDVQIGPS